MSSSYEKGQAALAELIAWYEANVGEPSRNEATTRLHLVDVLLTQVLGWPRAELRAEQRLGEEYVDYAVGAPATRLILEAKRDGTYFSVPMGATSTRHRIRSLTADPANQALAEALEQVARYCATRGVPLAAVCNGTQLVAFLGSGSTVSVRWTERRSSSPASTRCTRASAPCGETCPVRGAGPHPTHHPDRG